MMGSQKRPLPFLFFAVFWYTPETVQRRLGGPEPPPRQVFLLQGIRILFLLFVDQFLSFRKFPAGYIYTHIFLHVESEFADEINQFPQREEKIKVRTV